MFENGSCAQSLEQCCVKGEASEYSMVPVFTAFMSIS